jgi:hypothetical protein
MPPLSVIFDEAGTAGTLFAGQSMLPLTTHCNERPATQEQYVLKELVAYHIYNELTDMSMRVRLVRVRYEPSESSIRIESKRDAKMAAPFKANSAPRWACVRTPSALAQSSGSLFNSSTGSAGHRRAPNSSAVPARAMLETNTKTSRTRTATRFHMCEYSLWPPI